MKTKIEIKMEIIKMIKETMFKNNLILKIELKEWIKIKVINMKMKIGIEIRK